LTTFISLKESREINLALSQGKSGEYTWPSLEESREIKLGHYVTIYQHGMVAFYYNV
jgi:hypothetical protein